MDQNGHRDGVYGQPNTAVHHSSMEVIQDSELLFHRVSVSAKRNSCVCRYVIMTHAHSSSELYNANRSILTSL